ncbi:Gfo/Idh/MocA family protein [Oceanobacillus kapialis]|uniref:Gfo/Idh/MocA family protein n=1 Tax=Oceanobacillus kapialis TaxID=481353 RepID=UPI00384D0694
MLNVGLIGCGYISGKHLSSLSKMRGMQLTAVSDIDEKNMKKAVENYKNQSEQEVEISCYKNYGELLENPTIDVVVVTVISGLHAAVASEAIRHGKHVMLEKPIALSLKEADELILLAKTFKRKVLVCHQLRYRPLLQQLKEKVMEGAFGKPHLATISLRLYRSPSYFENSNWKGTWEQDGGMLINQGIHLVDQLLWMMGDLETAYGELGKALHTKETEDVATGIFHFSNRSKGLIEANTITIPQNLGYQLTVFGDEGSFSVGGRNFNELTHCYMDKEEERKELYTLASDMNEHSYMYEDMLQAIVNDRQPAVSLLEGKKALEAIFALYRADRKSAVISLPLDDFTTKEMGGKIE